MGKRTTSIGQVCTLQFTSYSALAFHPVFPAAGPTKETGATESPVETAALALAPSDAFSSTFCAPGCAPGASTRSTLYAGDVAGSIERTGPIPGGTPVAFTQGLIREW